MTAIDMRIIDPDDNRGLPWPDIREAVIDGTPILNLERAAVVANYTRDGNPGILLVATGRDGKPVILQTTATLLDMIAGATRGACRKWGLPNW